MRIMRSALQLSYARVSEFQKHQCLSDPKEKLGGDQTDQWHTKELRSLKSLTSYTHVASRTGDLHCRLTADQHNKN